MSSANEKILEGVFAINKPQNLSSAQVLRDLQSHFNPSRAFAPWLARERSIRAAERHEERRRRKPAKRQVQVKLGHGGTLDPLATGVLIVGVGKGTKSLQSFLECTKTYETVVLFGCATDSYDRLGKIVARKDASGITRERVEDALKAFRGKIMQKPPLFSALRMDGKRLYDYAREGKEIPREIEARPIEVVEMELVEWMEPGSHEHKLPSDDAPVEDKVVAQNLLKVDGLDTDAASLDLKRKRNEAESLNVEEHDAKKSKHHSEHASPGEQNVQGGESIKEADAAISTETNGEDRQPESLAHPDDETASTSAHTQIPAQLSPPAAKIRMTVTSGFYVRSLCHDLGIAVGSLGVMGELVRTRQADFTLGQNVLEYTDLDKGEEEWAPKVEKMLCDWNDKLDSQ